MMFSRICLFWNRQFFLPFALRDLIRQHGYEVRFWG